MPVSNDRQERERVRSRIEALIREFCRENDTFHMDQLTFYVQARMKVAPDSPGRILRQLRQQRRLNYDVISRRESLYQVRPVVKGAPTLSTFAMSDEEWQKG